MRSLSAFWFLMVGFSAFAEGLLDRVHLDVAPDEAVVSIRYYPPDGTRAEQTAAAREVYSGFQKRIQAENPTRITLHVSDFGTRFSPTKGLSASGETGTWFLCEVSIRLATQTNSAVWENALVIGQVVDILEEFAKGQTIGLADALFSSKSPSPLQFDLEYRRRNMDRVRLALMQQVGERAGQWKQTLSGAVGGEAASIQLAPGEVITASSSVTAVRYELPFELKLEEKH